MNPQPSLALLRALRPMLPQRWRLPAAFDPAGYLIANPDVAAEGSAALWHFLRHGRAEGLLPASLQAARLEQALWAGEVGAQQRLQALAAEMAGAEGLWARLALARVAAQRGEIMAAHHLLGEPAPLIQFFGLLDPLLFLAEIALRCGDTTRAAQAMRLATQGFGTQAALTFLQAASDLQQRVSTQWSEQIAPVYSAQGLPPPRLAQTPAVAFDRLSGESAAPIAEGPLVSIILPARNAATTIDTALASLAAQSWRQIEVLVVDNGSTDATAARALNWAARDARIRLIDGAAASGAYGARNLGAGLATGAMITVQDADDWSHPDRIARQMQALQEAPANPANLSHWLRMTPDLCPVFWRPDIRPVHPNLSSLMLRREVFGRLGPWDEVPSGADSGYINRLRATYGAAALQQALPGLPMAFGRVTPDSLTQNASTGLLGAGAAARRRYLSTTMGGCA